MPEVTRASLGLATTDSPTFAGATFSGAVNVTRQNNAFSSGSAYLALLMGDLTGANAANGGLYAFARHNKSKKPFVGVSGWDDGGGRAIYYGGGGWGVPDAMLHVFHTAPTYSETNNTGPERMRITPAGNVLIGTTVDNTPNKLQLNGNALFYKVNPSATSYEALQIDATGDASNFDIAASIGSAGGTARGIRIGGKDAAGTFTSWMSFATTGGATFSSFINATSIRCDGSQVLDTSGTLIDVGSAGGFLSCKLLNNFSNAVKLIVGSSSTTLSPAIHVPAATNAIAFKSADGTIDTPISAASGTFSGALQIGNAAVAETPVATHTLIIKDSTGTSYRVLAVAV